MNSRLKIASASLVFVLVFNAGPVNGESNSPPGASGVNQSKSEPQPDFSLVNRWYFEGCLTGCARGYIVGYLIGCDQAGDARRKKATLADTTADWPQGKLTREIQTELDDILSNEERSKPDDGFPQPLPRVISSPQQLPIRHAGIYSTFHAAVHDGFKDGYLTQKPDHIGETNNYLKRYAASHAPDLPEGVAKEILRQHMVYLVD